MMEKPRVAIPLRAGHRTFLRMKNAMTYMVVMRGAPEASETNRSSIAKKILTAS